eukprot:TRINITY_DN4311_c0_g2_i3.p1 TRINITY_DN4311_c0_g2~~TRINITY_DN4311_c0_g2_i3.p1  ORF type:complete len:228 (-),score=30.29 TRINITY_DN4311_c0_g2_i3:577-1260(-)
MHEPNEEHLDIGTQLSCKSSILAGLYKKRILRLKKMFRECLIGDKEGCGVDNKELNEGDTSLKATDLHSREGSLQEKKDKKKLNVSLNRAAHLTRMGRDRAKRDSFAFQIEHIIGKRSSGDSKFQSSINRYRKPFNNRRRLIMRKSSVTSYMRGDSRGLGHFPVVITPNSHSLNKSTTNTDSSKENAIYTNILLKNHMLLQKLKTALIMNPSRLVEIIHVVSFFNLA